MISEMFDFSRESGLKDTLFHRMSAAYDAVRYERTPLSLTDLESDAGLRAGGSSSVSSPAEQRKEKGRER